MSTEDQDDTRKDEAMHKALMLHLAILKPKSRGEHVAGLIDLCTVAMGAVRALSSPAIAENGLDYIRDYLKSEGGVIDDAGRAVDSQLAAIRALADLIDTKEQSHGR